jgi:hypothetical protein
MLRDAQRYLQPKRLVLMSLVHCNLPALDGLRKWPPARLMGQAILE